MRIGYARVSSDDQDLTLQEDALNQAGCRQIFRDTMRGARSERPVLQDVLNVLRDDEDVLVVWRLDRLGRSFKHLVEVVNDLEVRGIGLQSLQEKIDTTTSGGRMVFHVFAALAEFERNLIRERTQSARSAARARGKKGGRRKVLDEQKRQRLYQLYDDANADGSRTYAIKEICEMMDISKSTLYAYLRQQHLTSSS